MCSQSRKDSLVEEIFHWGPLALLLSNKILRSLLLFLIKKEEMGRI